MKKLLVTITIFTLLAITNHASASSTPIMGVGSAAENACICFVEIFTGKSTAYNEVSFFGPFPAPLWPGPIYSGGYYTQGSGPGLANPGGVTPGGKQSPVLSGKISVSGSGPGAVIGGRVDVGRATFAFLGQGSDTAEVTWKRLRYEIADKVADSATPNAAGGFTYVIGTQGVPDLLVDLTGTDTFPSEVGGELTFPPFVIPFWKNPGIPGLHDTAGIATIEPNVTGLANIGTTATASFQKMSCTDIVGTAACGVKSAINVDPDIDNLIMVIDTNACGRVMTGFAYATRETNVFGPPSRDNWNATTWAFESVSEDGNGCID